MKCIEVGQSVVYEKREAKNPGRPDMFRARVAFCEYEGSELVSKQPVNLNFPERYPPGRYSISADSLILNGYDIKVGFACKLVPMKPAESSKPVQAAS